ncbi:MAG: hypothetical protein KGL90_09245 [Burkholderiales bacterium]|nr:hypothetical protein [Burkholderiales bacterium]
MEPDTHEKVLFLGSRAAHPGTSGPIEMIETHMSWVVLAGDRALKLKKPMRTAWCDFSTLKARELNAREEVRLNRRLAPDVYLGLLALQWTNGHFAFAPDAEAMLGGHTVDWLVLMRRLPAERMLDRMIAAGTVTSSHIDALIQVLARFYQETPRATLSADDYVAHFASEQVLNRDVLLRPDFELTGAMATLDAFDQAIAEHAQSLRERVLQGRLLDGHGDLRPEHVCLLPRPVIIDALEFNASLRQVDPLDELVFLGLECELAGAPWITAHLLSRYGAALNDPAPAALVRFYTASRALLRARLCAAHLIDPATCIPSKWLPRAQHYLDRTHQALQHPLSVAMPHGSA